MYRRSRAPFSRALYRFALGPFRVKLQRLGALRSAQVEWYRPRAVHKFYVSTSSVVVDRDSG